jgi:hypothetical protein
LALPAFPAGAAVLGPNSSLDTSRSIPSSTADAHPYSSLSPAPVGLSCFGALPSYIAFHPLSLRLCFLASLVVSLKHSISRLFSGPLVKSGLRGAVVLEARAVNWRIEVSTC